MNDPWTGQRSASGEKQKISTHLLLGETLRGRLVMSKKSLNAVKNKQLNDNACKQWQVVRDSCRSTSTCSRSTLSEVSPRTRHKTTDAVLSSIPRDALSALTPECVPHSRSRRPQVQVGIAFVFTGLRFSCSCVCFIHRIVLRFLS